MKKDIEVIAGRRILKEETVHEEFKKETYRAFEFSDIQERKVVLGQLEKLLLGVSVENTSNLLTARLRTLVALFDEHECESELRYYWS
jgi:hypothetical protein